MSVIAVFGIAFFVFTMLSKKNDNRALLVQDV